jgi:hypothetical protein
MMNRLVSDTGWDLWLRWMIATGIAWIVGMTAAFPLSYLLNVVYPKTTNVLVGLCLGAAVGVAQKIAAKRWIDLTWSWVWGAVIGVGAPFVVAEIIDVLWPGSGGYTGDRMSVWALVICAGGLIAGSLQMRVLQRFTPKAVWWVPASIVSWGLAWFVMDLAGMMGLAAGGAVLGAVSGGFLLWIFKNPVDAVA